MKKMMKAVCLAMVFVMILSCSAFAATIQLDTPTVDKAAKTAVVSGKIADPAADSQVTILVVESGTALSNLSDDKIAYVDQAPLNEDGTFSFSLAINQEKFTGDKFTAYLGGTGVTTVGSTPLNFGNAKPGDVDGDERVYLSDYLMVCEYYGQNVPAGTNGDADGSGRTYLEDYMMVCEYYGQ